MHAQNVPSAARLAWLPRAIVSGFIAAVAMLFTFLPAYGLSYLVSTLRLRGNDRSADIIYTWFYGLTHNSLTDLAGSNLYAVAGLHFFIAIGWALIYAYFAESRLEGPGWLRGLCFSLLPWILSVLLVLPLGGGGLLGLGLGAGPLPILGNLVLHLAYGVTLGTVYGPLGDIPADTFPRTGPEDDFETTRRAETRTAMGIVAGLVIGLLASIVLALVLGAGPSAPILGIPGAAVVLGSTLLGGTLGGLLGSFTGLAAPR